MTDGRTGGSPRPGATAVLDEVDDPTRPLDRFDDPSGPLPFSRRRTRIALGLVAVLVVVALFAALFVLPVRAWLNQRSAIAEAERELDVLWAENRRLEQRYDDLQSPAEIERLARAEYGLVKPGEVPYSMLPAPPVRALPSGWPYETVESILARRTGAATRAEPATTTAPAGSLPAPVATLAP